MERIVPVLFFCLIIGQSLLSQRTVEGHSDFVYVASVVKGIQYDMRYAGSYNFIGRPIDGYAKNAEPILTRLAATALQKVQLELNKQNLGLKIFDAYRPQSAVDHFVRWAAEAGDTLNRRKFYPAIPKNKLFKLGYIASRSGHSRGSTVDLTIIDLNTGKELDMGGSYDFFGPRSHHNFTGLTETQKSNRLLLLTTMGKNGFRPYAEEWWHYTLNAEPFPDKYFNFPVE